MRMLFMIAMVIVVLMVSADAKQKRRNKLREIGCHLNGQVFEAGELAYKDEAHCLKLQCVKKTNKKGKTKYLLKAKALKGCRCSLPCPKCSNNWDPVCGTNNKTYVNQCQLWGMASPCGEEQADLLHEGECGMCPTSCPQVIKPVCGSDNKTYDSECQFLMSSCNDPNPMQVANRVSCEDAQAYSAQGNKCKYNNKRFNIGETIEYLGSFCLEITCQPPTDTKRPVVTFMEFQGSRTCDCSSKEPENDDKWMYNVTPQVIGHSN